MKILFFLALVFSESAFSQSQTHDLALLAKLQEVEKVRDQVSEEDRLSQVFEATWNWALTEFPAFAYSEGYSTDGSRWNDISEERSQERLNLDRRTLNVLGGIEPKDRAARIHRDIRILLDSKGLLHGEFHTNYLDLNQLSGPQSWVPATLAGMPHTKPEHFEFHIQRLEGIPPLLAEFTNSLKLGVAAKMTSPRFLVEMVPLQIDKLIPEAPLESALLADFKSFPSEFSKKQKEDLLRKAEKVYRQVARPTWIQFRKFLVEEYIPACRTTIAARDLPRGSEFYDFQLSLRTTTKMSAKEIHQLGLKEVQRIQNEMENLVRKAGHQTISNFIKALRANKANFFETPESVLVHYRDIAKRIDGELPRLFRNLPALPYGIKAIPEHMAQGAPAAYYESGSLESGRSGTFFANTSSPQSHPRWEGEALTLHETVPGHHLQIALARELKGLPEFRKHAGFTAYTEGWGLYAESLGEDLGLYQTAETKFGRLTYELARALRLVVDTGIHSLGWSRDKTLDYMARATGRAREEFQAEVDRYIVWPGQAVAYKVGEIFILRLKAKAQKRLGKKFDVRDFHSVILENGAVPLEVLEGLVDEWISNQISK